jgi:hypothetical protein
MTQCFPLDVKQRNLLSGTGDSWITPSSRYPHNVAIGMWPNVPRPTKGTGVVFVMKCVFWGNKADFDSDRPLGAGIVRSMSFVAV